MWPNRFNIIIVTLLALLIRLISLNQSLWWDEAINVVYARQSGFLWFITRYPLGDFHPPGWFALLWSWGNLFGWSEVSVRMPSVLFGVGAVYVTYLIGEKLFSKKIGLLSALMLAFAPLHIYYSQEARMYAFGAFAVTFSIYSLVRFIKEEKYSFMFFALSVALVLYSDYVTYFIFPVLFIYMMCFYRQLMGRFVSSFAFGIVFFIPWVFIFPDQLMNGQRTALSLLGWGNVVGGSSIKELILLPIKVLVGKVDLYNNFLYVGLIIVTTTPFLITFIKLRKVLDSRYYLILLWLLVTPILVWIFSFIIPIFSYFRLLYILPAFYIAVSVCLYRFSKTSFQILIFFILTFEVLLSSVYLFNVNYHREDWRGAVQFVDQKMNDDSLVIFRNSEIAAPYNYYSRFLQLAIPAYKVVPVKTKNDIQDLNNVLQGRTQIYLFDYLKDITDPDNILETYIEENRFKKISIDNFNGVGFITTYRKND
ncbi:MAG: glycosyltransferase family 39 protein [Candidatus Daviesbacteria bacterium]|nr:glycosyltransferase family 39 protein [Candidatus Daviesbacteria bacterium]